MLIKEVFKWTAKVVAIEKQDLKDCAKSVSDTEANKI
jgi:hypothetical protein